MLKAMKNKNINIVNTDNNDDNDSNNDNDMYSDWSSQTTWQRLEQLERIESYIENLLFMITNLYWIGLIIIISQIMIATAFIIYAFTPFCRCCGKRKQHSNKHRTTPSNNSTSNRFNFTRTLSHSPVNIKRNHRKKFKK